MPRVLSALMFFPRGGSAHVARALARSLPAHGWDVTLLSGSLPGAGDARRFYADVEDLHVVDFSAPGVPMHPSYEDRPGAPDVVFARVDDAGFERHLATWAAALEHAGAARADVLHLHHLTPIHAAAARVAPGVPVVGHLHGTELLFLEQHPDGPWAERMRGWAQGCERLVLLSPSQVDRAEALLGIDPARCVVVPNGFEPERFQRRPIDRAAHWRRHLVEAPQGWRPGGEAGSVAYTAEQVAPLTDPATAVLLSVGRFTAVKRTPLLVEAFAEARARIPGPAALVLVGGHPGEWEGEHPADTVDRLGVPGAFLAGWHDHDALPAFLSAADVLALASVREQFGQVLVEGMACGLAPVAVGRFGPAEIVDDGRTGWLVPPDDRGALATALAHALGDPAERTRRGTAALTAARRRYGWPALAGRLAEVLTRATARPPCAPPSRLTSRS